MADAQMEGVAAQILGVEKEIPVAVGDIAQERENLTRVRSEIRAAEEAGKTPPQRWLDNEAGWRDSLKALQGNLAQLRREKEQLRSEKAQLRGQSHAAAAAPRDLSTPGEVRDRVLEFASEHQIAYFKARCDRAAMLQSNNPEFECVSREKSFDAAMAAFERRNGKKSADRPHNPLTAILGHPGSGKSFFMDAFGAEGHARDEGSGGSKRLRTHNAVPSTRR